MNTPMSFYLNASEIHRNPLDIPLNTWVDGGGGRPLSALGWPFGLPGGRIIRKALPYSKKYWRRCRIGADLFVAEVSGAHERPKLEEMIRDELSGFRNRREYRPRHPGR